jgi:putative transposase
MGRCSPVRSLSTSDHVSYINLCGTFYYLCSILDGFSRFLVHWDLREAMREADVEVILQRAKEKYPEATAARQQR